jgi:hypothetical protein
MRIAIGVFLGSTATGGPPSPYAAYALAEVFTLPQYWVAGTQYTPITALPGYTFTRSGQQGAVDASGAVRFFGANVPAINSAGFHNYGANTNTLLNSNDANARGVSNCTVVSDNAVAPDGTTAADTATVTASPASISTIGASVTAAAIYTASIFIKKTSTTAFGYFQINDGGGPTNASFITFNLSTGAVGTSTNLLGTLPLTGYAVDRGSYWQLIVTFTPTQTTAFCYFGPADTANTRNTTAGVTFVVWQQQLLLGNFPNGGPLIATTTAAASIGANAFTNTVANGSYSAVYTFDDNSTQTIATTIAAGVFTFPTTLNRNVVKQVLMN